MFTQWFGSTTFALFNVNRVNFEALATESCRLYLCIRSTYLAKQISWNPTLWSSEAQSQNQVNYLYMTDKWTPPWKRLFAYTTKMEKIDCNMNLDYYKTIIQRVRLMYNLILIERKSRIQRPSYKLKDWCQMSYNGMRRPKQPTLE